MVALKIKSVRHLIQSTWLLTELHTSDGNVVLSPVTVLKCTNVGTEIAYTPHFIEG